VRSVIDAHPARSGAGDAGPPSAPMPVPEARAVPQSGDASGKAPVLRHASARHRARASYAAA